MRSTGANSPLRSARWRPMSMTTRLPLAHGTRTYSPVTAFVATTAAPVAVHSMTGQHSSPVTANEVSPASVIACSSP